MEERAKQNGWHAALAIMLLAAMLLLPGCSSQQPPAQAPASAPAVPASPPAQTGACADKTCFMQYANNCQDFSITLNEEIGTVSYSSSSKCIFTKTIVQANANENAEVKALLQGKSLTCTYQKGNFYSGWATSMIAGLENCNGNLKDTLAELILFTS